MTILAAYHWVLGQAVASEVDSLSKAECLRRGSAVSLSQHQEQGTTCTRATDIQAQRHLPGHSAKGAGPRLYNTSSSLLALILRLWI